MRVIIYVPDSRGAARTRRAIEREVSAQGHEVVGCTSMAAEAKAAWRTGVVDRIAGRPDHLIGLAEHWAHPVWSRRHEAHDPNEQKLIHPNSPHWDGADVKFRDPNTIGRGTRGLSKPF